MQLNSDIYSRLAEVKWFQNVGEKGDQLDGSDLDLVWIEERAAALQSILSYEWQDVKTEAQGDLTGYLAKNHYNHYGGYWNQLARDSKSRLRENVKPSIEKALGDSDLPVDLLDPILLDVNRIALESCYASRFRRVPRFFERLLLIYENGHLPCGWRGGLQSWPIGQLEVY